MRDQKTPPGLRSSGAVGVREAVFGGGCVAAGAVHAIWRPRRGRLAMRPGSGVARGAVVFRRLNFRAAPGWSSARHPAPRRAAPADGEEAKAVSSTPRPADDEINVSTAAFCAPQPRGPIRATPARHRSARAVRPHRARPDAGTPCTKRLGTGAPRACCQVVAGRLDSPNRPRIAISVRSGAIVLGN